jgi:hypothetical protein
MLVPNLLRDPRAGLMRVDAFDHARVELWRSVK